MTSTRPLLAAGSRRSTSSNARCLVVVTGSEDCNLSHHQVREQLAALLTSDRAVFAVTPVLHPPEQTNTSSPGQGGRRRAGGRYPRSGPTPATTAAPPPQPGSDAARPDRRAGRWRLRSRERLR